jgi:hypothetical protein
VGTKGSEATFDKVGSVDKDHDESTVDVHDEIDGERPNIVRERQRRDRQEYQQ